MRTNKMAAIMLTALMLFCAIGCIQTSNADAAEDYILIDSGNGETEWSPVSASAGDTVSDVIKKTAESYGMTYSFDGTKIAVNSIVSKQTGTGSGSGSYVTPGTTSVTVTSSWHAFKWNGSAWTVCPVSELSAAYVNGSYAIGFYPDGTVPVETPACQTSWVMVRGDARQTGNQTATFSVTDEAKYEWKDTSDIAGGVCSAITSVQDKIFVKYGAGSGMSAGSDAALICYSLTGEKLWSFEFPGVTYFETSTPVIVGDFIYIPDGYGGYGNIFKMPWKTGPGTDNSDVKMLGNIAYDADAVKEGTYSVPVSTGAELQGKDYNTGFGSLVYDSGCIFGMASNGMVYCFSQDLELIWSAQMLGHTYYISPTVYDGYVFAGAYDGSISVIDQFTGEIYDTENVISSLYHGKNYGYVGAVSVFKDEDSYILFASANDGRGMDVRTGGLMTAVFNSTSTKITSCSVEKVKYGLLPNYLLSAKLQDFEGVYFTASNGFFRVSVSGTSELLHDPFGEIHAPAVMVNNEKIYITSYTAGKPNFILGTDGKILESILPAPGIRDYCMSPATVLGDRVFFGNDAGMYSVYGVFPKYVEPSSDEGTPFWVPLLITIGVIIAILAALYCGLKFIGKKDHPFEFLQGSIRNFFSGDGYSHNTKSKRRLIFVLILGMIAVIVMFFISLANGSSGSMSIGEAWTTLCSAISKGGQNLSYEETIVYDSRFPRALAAIAVGIGLSIAGSIYQAIIRNPLVDPYIMGVSSGAGTAAIAVIAFDFTFFGLFPAHSPFLVAATAMIGGIVAFVCTMIIAERAGGSSVNYVLAGVVVGLAFSALQTIMMSMAGHKISNVLTWLFGSFSNVSWDQLWIIVIPAIALSLAPLLWAKEFNLILLGEDQAKQMGLNVRAFTIGMLTLASVLASVCVAFVGVIGFVGLVVPHLCRMFLGGDHRLVMPTSIVTGAFLMLIADFVSRMMLFGQELPVGAITTIIGVPVFAWLLIKKGRMYDG